MSEIDEEGPWGIVEDHCRDCGLLLMIVATVECIEQETAEIWADGSARCSECRNRRQIKLLALRLLNDVERWREEK